VGTAASATRPGASGVKAASATPTNEVLRETLARLQVRL
jgi:hypothetical protein